MIYFARTPDTGSIKIGFSDDVEARMVELASYYRAAPELLHTIEGDRDTERAMHARFDQYRIDRTEQFRPGPDLMGFIGHPTPRDWQSVGRNRQAQFIGVRMTAQELEALKLTAKRMRKTMSGAIKAMVRDEHARLDRAEARTKKTEESAR